jgi:protein-disulfide isomerase
MSKLVVACVVMVGACQSNTMALEQKVDNLTTQLAATQHALADVQQRLDHPSVPAELERAVAEIAKKLDALLAAGNRQGYVPPRRRPEPDRAKVYAVAVDGHPFEGPRDAIITMVVALDYADPYTERSRDTRVQLRKKYGNDLRIVYRNFVVHPTVATAAALASCAADKQKKFAAYDDVLWEKGFKARQFDNNLDDASSHCWEGAAGCPIALGFAKELHLDLVKFKRDMTSCETEVKADMAELQRFGVGATPSFFINGRFMSGAMPLEDFTMLIDEELKKANERLLGGASRATYYNDWVLAKGLKQLEP